MSKDERIEPGAAGRPGAVMQDHNKDEDEDAGVSDEVLDDSSGREERRHEVARPAQASEGGIGLRIYKPNQGYHTRVGTAIGAGVLIVAGTVFVFNELEALLDPNAGYFVPVQYGISVGFMLVMAALVYWTVGLSPRANDFFIATEGEMKKVSWSSRKELIRSTKVVIATVLLLSTMLFVVDIGFMLFFGAIKVLEVTPTWDRLFGSGS